MSFFKVFHLSFFFLLPFAANSQAIRCNDLMDYVTDEGVSYGQVYSYQLTNSSWLKEVKAYKYENILFVIAEIKQDDWGIRTKKYIFCGIPENNWRNFTSSYDRRTYGERFHDYIMDYRCDCY